MNYVISPYTFLSPIAGAIFESIGFYFFARMPSQRKITFLVLSCLCLFFRTSYSQTVDCNVHWDAPLQVSYDSIFYSVPQLSVSGDTVHAIWFGTDFFGTVSHDGVQYSHSYDGGHSFSPPVTLSSFDSAITPGLVASSGTNVYVAGEIAVGAFAGTSFMRSTDAGQTWIPAMRLLDKASPILLEAIDDVVYFHYFNRSLNRNGLFRSTDNGVSWIVQSPNMLALSSLYVTRTQLHAVTSLGTNIKDVIYYSSENFGATWFYQEIISNDDFTTSLFPRITGNGNRDLYVVWNDTNTIFMRRSVNNGLFWLPAVKVSTDPDAVFPDIGASREFVSVVWDDDNGATSNIHLRPSNDRGLNFCPEDLPGADSGIGGPAIRVSGNNVHLIWSKLEGITGTISYRHGTLTENPNDADRPPKEYALFQNFPNPFNGITRIQFHLPQPTHVRLTVYDLLGQQVARLVDEDRPEGRYEVAYNLPSLASGVYFYKLETNEYVEWKKMSVVR